MEELRKKSKINKWGMGGVYLVLKSTHFIHFSIAGYTSVYLQRYRNPLTFLGTLSDFSIRYQHIAYLVVVSMKSLMIQSTRVAESYIRNH